MQYFYEHKKEHIKGQHNKEPISGQTPKLNQIPYGRVWENSKSEHARELVFNHNIFSKTVADVDD